MLQAIVYDLDGTLVDSRADLADSVNAMLRRLGLPERADRELWSFVGHGAERLIRSALGAAHQHRFEEAAQAWWSEYDARLLRTTRFYDGIPEVLRAPPRRRAVLTNKPGPFARRILAGLGEAQAFSAVVGGDEAARKPAPDGLLALCRALETAPAEALMVGDSAVDLATARAAGVRVCAVSWGFGARAELAAADYVCDRPQELLALLLRLAGG